jgi:hypothetical protein
MKDDRLTLLAPLMNLADSKLKEHLSIMVEPKVNALEQTHIIHVQ